MTFNPLDNDSPDLLPSTVSVTSPPQHGKATVDAASGLITFTPAEHFNGKDQMAYQACNISGSCSFATISLRVSPYGNYRIVAGVSDDGSSNASATFLLNPDGSGIPQPIQPAFGLSTISPDGSRVASVSGDTVIVQPVDNPSLLDIIQCQASGQIMSYPHPGHLTAALNWRLPRPSTIDPEGYLVILTVQVPLSSDNSLQAGRNHRGFVKEKPIGGQNPNWGISGIAFDSYFDFTGTEKKLTQGIFVVTPGSDPSVLYKVPFSSYPGWSPDGATVAYVVNGAGGGAVFVGDKPIVNSLGPFESVAWSPDGSKLVITQAQI